MTIEQYQIIERLKFEKLEIVLSKKANRFVEHIQTEFANGGMKLFNWKIISTSSKNILYKDPFEEVAWQILKNQNLESDLASITQNTQIADRPKDLKLSNTFELLGKLSGLAKHGGAYSARGEKLTDNQAIEISKDFINEFLPKSFDDYHCYMTFTPWANWFYNVAWDFTAIIFSKHYDEMKLICLTDTD